MAEVNDMFDDITKEQSFFNPNSDKSKKKYIPLVKGEYFGHIVEVTTKILDVKGGKYKARLYNYIAQLYVQNNKRMFNKTSNVLLGEYRQRSPLWKPTVHNLKARVNRTKSGFSDWQVVTTRICYAHEYIGDINTQWKKDLEDWGLVLTPQSSFKMDGI